eukprot:scaffold4078_cov68-Phaeocystis_antarctica.AAC.29
MRANSASRKWRPSRDFAAGKRRRLQVRPAPVAPATPSQAARSRRGDVVVAAARTLAPCTVAGESCRRPRGNAWARLGKVTRQGAAGSATRPWPPGRHRC